jgi:hypothetical protein
MRHDIPLLKSKSEEIQIVGNFLFTGRNFIKKTKNTWEGAFRVCRSIGMEMLAVEYDDKDGCIAKLAKSKKHQF